ncbi:NAD(P) transhydrogenase subunit alpha [Methylacidimicrobium cyclopophantes]|uniref:proton-translocating NAD(P)(+) transhydrogenase n=1 Tax=Methylacidimicrobium cyclopophantes TaxID=1041766 RepID=A0A5E6M6C7_9BACT|nr:NAD(P) transhydrogenase subunit alpha [Methylacidimicrobium cyclopophantes]VVM04901.1 NAD(P) transhydrogenase subunit alpha [Methylacidimicrobium cyclopophantes]
MNGETTLTGFLAIYLFLMAAFTGYEVISRVPSILHTPLMSGSNFIHGIVVVGAIYALLHATTVTEQAIGFFGVLFGAANAAGGYVVTVRMLRMFHSEKPSKSSSGQRR